MNMIKNIPEREFGGVYALVDDNGKMYIGSSRNIKKRMAFHKTHMNSVVKTGGDGFVNPSMQAAILSGLRFTCIILAELSCDMEDTEIREIERVFISHFGGLGNLYNSRPIAHKV